MAREQAQAQGVDDTFRRYEARERDLAAARQMLDDAELAALAAEEIESAGADLERLHAELQAALLPHDPDDERNAFVEVRAALISQELGGPGLRGLGRGRSHDDRSEQKDNHYRPAI